MLFPGYSNVRLIELSASHTEFDNYNSFSEYIDLAVHLNGNRLIPYTAKGLPQDKRYLYLGVNWVWNSFSKKLGKVATMMILSSFQNTRFPEDGEFALRSYFKWYWG